MICITCGNDNPAHLLYCQECGQRLGVPRAAPAAAPVPETKVSLPANPPTRPPPLPPEARGAPSSRSPSTPSQRPPAPDLNFAGREGTSPAPAAAQEAVPCPLCGNRNPRTLRFCVTCGHLLAPPSLPPGLPPPQSFRPAALPAAPTIVPTASARPAPLPAEPAAPAEGSTVRPPPNEPLSSTAPSPIAPARVVEVGSAPSEAMLRLCPRCRGGSDPTSQFCRFCGASLAEAASISLAPRNPSPLPPQPPDPGAAVVSVPVTPIPPGTMRPSSAPRSTVAMVSPSPGAAGRARLVLIARDGGEGPSYPLGETTDVGRSEGHILVSDDRYVSPRHARLMVRAGAYYLRDLGSTNGVYMRIPFAREPGQRVGGASAGHGGGGAGSLEQPILDQDLFLVGQQVLKFEVVKHAEEGFGVASENGTLVFGTPSAPRYARLTQRTVEGVARDVFHLQKAETIIGREIGDVVFTDDPFLSRRHAAIVVHATTPGAKGQPRRFSLMDLGSSNGTFLQLREEVRLKSGDHLRIGQQLFRFDLDRVDA